MRVSVVYNSAHSIFWIYGKKCPLLCITAYEFGRIAVDSGSFSGQIGRKPAMQYHNLKLPKPNGDNEPLSLIGHLEWINEKFRKNLSCHSYPLQEYIFWFHPLPEVSPWEGVASAQARGCLPWALRKLFQSYHYAIHRYTVPSSLYFFTFFVCCVGLILGLASMT